MRAAATCRRHARACGLAVLGLAVLLCAVSGCGRSIAPIAPSDPPTQVRTAVRVTESGADTTPHIHGLSALARAPDGTLWSITEREDWLVRLRLREGALQVEPLPLQGKPAGLDGEGLALWQERSDSALQFAVGTESHGGPRSRDAILLGHFDAHAAVVDQTLWLDYAPWGVQAEDNRGLEGVCWADGLWVLAETAIEQAAVRWSPLGRRNPDGSWTALRLPLTSRDGRFSALACRSTRAADGQPAVELWAIERQYGVSRWVHTVVATAAAADAPLHTEVVADLAAPAFQRLGTVPNFEGLAGDPRDPSAAWLVADNDRGGLIQGPNLLVRVAPR